MPLYPEDPEIGNPLGVAALADGPLAAAFPPGALLILAGLPVGPGRRCRGPGAPAAWSGSSCAGWWSGAWLAAVALVVALVVEAGASVVRRAAVGGGGALLPLATGAAILRYRL